MTVGAGTILYFAYGSNLCVPRLKDRTPGAEQMGRATLPGYALRWHKRSVDGSGKCDVVPWDAEDSAVHGALYAIPIDEMGLLDEVEGLGDGYDRMTVKVEAFDRELIASMYTAAQTHIDPDLRPYSWYKSLVIAGAEAHLLPSSYVQEVRRVHSVPDPDRARAFRNRVFISPT